MKLIMAEYGKLLILHMLLCNILKHNFEEAKRYYIAQEAHSYDHRCAKEAAKIRCMSYFKPLKIPVFQFGQQNDPLRPARNHTISIL